MTGKGLDSGFGLLELVVGLAFLAILAGGILQACVTVGESNTTLQKARLEALRKWNLSRELRAAATPSSVVMGPFEESRPLFRHTLQGEVLGSRAWEIWVGER